MPRTIRGALAVLLLTLLLFPPSALADHPAGSGGAVALARAEVSELRCEETESAACPRGELLEVAGLYLESTRSVVFLGGRGRRDDRRARPADADPHLVRVRVPRSARSGRVRVITRHTGASAPGPKLRIVPTTRNRIDARAPASSAPDGAEAVFPVRGKHSFGTETNGFGGGRNHQGHDIFAACGTKVVAAMAGKVSVAKFHDRAGNYVVIKADDGTSHAYMHLVAPASVAPGERVSAGQVIGQVGETGRASGCHLHFELWTAPGWYEGGSPIDPLPALKRWDASS